MATQSKCRVAVGSVSAVQTPADRIQKAVRRAGLLDKVFAVPQLNSPPGDFGAIPAGVVAGLAILMVSGGARQHPEKVMQPVLAQTPPSPTPPEELQPSLANYQRMADRSPDALEELLDRQVKTLSGSDGAVYTAQVSLLY